MDAKEKRRKEMIRVLYFLIGAFLLGLDTFLWKTALGLTDPRLRLFLLKAEITGGYVGVGGIVIAFVGVYCLFMALTKIEFQSFRKRVRRGTEIWRVQNQQK